MIDTLLQIMQVILGFGTIVTLMIVVIKEHKRRYAVARTLSWYTLAFVVAFSLITTVRLIL